MTDTEQETQRFPQEGERTPGEGQKPPQKNQGSPWPLIAIIVGIAIIGVLIVTIMYNLIVAIMYNAEIDWQEVIIISVGLVVGSILILGVIRVVLVVALYVFQMLVGASILGLIVYAITSLAS